MVNLNTASLHRKNTTGNEPVNQSITLSTRQRTLGPVGLLLVERDLVEVAVLVARARVHYAVACGGYGGSRGVQYHAIQAMSQSLRTAADADPPPHTRSHHTTPNQADHAPLTMRQVTLLSSIATVGDSSA